MTHPRPIRVVLIDSFAIAVAGLRVLLAPHRSRVVVVDSAEARRDPSGIDVILYEPVRQTPLTQVLLRDLVRGAHAKAVIYSWRDYNKAQHGSFAGHVSKALPADELVAVLVHLTEVGQLSVRRPTPPDGDALATINRFGAADASLSPREGEVLSLITQGLTNQEIGAQLGLSQNSIKTNIRNAYRKIGAQRRSQAVLWGIEHGLGGPTAPLPKRAEPL